MMGEEAGEGASECPSAMSSSPVSAISRKSKHGKLIAETAETPFTRMEQTEKNALHFCTLEGKREESERPFAENKGN